MPIGPIGRRELAETPFNFDRFFAWTGYFSPKNSSPAARLLGASGRGCRPKPPEGDPPLGKHPRRVLNNGRLPGLWSCGKSEAGLVA